MKENASNQLADGEMIFAEGEKTGCIYMVMKGKVEIFSRGMKTFCGPGSLVGANNLFDDISRYSCRSCGESVVYALTAQSMRALNSFLNSNKDYGGITVYSHVRLITELSKHYTRLKESTATLFGMVKTDYTAYVDAIKSSGFKAELIPEIVSLNEYSPKCAQPEQEELSDCLEIARVPYETVKTYYSASPYLSVRMLERMFRLEDVLIDACNDAADYLADVFMLFAGDENYSLYRSVLGLGLSMKNGGASTQSVDNVISECIATVDVMRELLGENTGRGWGVNDEGLEALKKAFDNGEDFRNDNDENANSVDGLIAEYMASLPDSIGQIMQFGEYPEPESGQFRELVDAFIALPNKENTDDETRKLRKSISDHFYHLYLAVFVRALGKDRLPKAVELFLNYGYVSEKLLKEEQLIQILSIKMKECNEPCRVYFLRQWLEEVYSGRKEPSRNDMGQDYPEVLRELKKQGNITEAQEKELLTDGAKKLEYEVKNVFIHANRVVNGQLSTFVPILYSEEMYGEVGKAFNSPEKLNGIVQELTKIDFSVFYREGLFIDPNGKIERETIQKEVFPMFVIYPTVGQNAIMWQEITGRKRDSEGRFFVPAFSFNALRDMMIKAFGQFRWALCKTIQGTNWNNIQVHSLTADYSDYIQFYKKNKDLTDERKEKIKLQIQRGRNNLREIFAMDYEVWIKSEAAGAIRMNKVAREILATYCPFGAPIRTQLIKQPIYEEAFARYTRESGKKVHELNLRYKALATKKIELPPELTVTLTFYRDL